VKVVFQHVHQVITFLIHHHSLVLLVLAEVILAQELEHSQVLLHALYVQQILIILSQLVIRHLPAWLVLQILFLLLDLPNALAMLDTMVSELQHLLVWPVRMDRLAPLELLHARLALLELLLIELLKLA
jgi:hypothetical protein